MLDGATNIESEIDEYIDWFFEYLKDDGICVGDKGKDKLYIVFNRLKSGFGLEIRKTGEPYISHLIEVTKIFIESVGISGITYDDLIISLLHDSIEDVNEESFFSIQKDFGDYVALGVSALSKPNIEEKSERDKEYYPRFTSLGSLEDYIKRKEKRKSLSLNDGDRKRLTRVVASIKISDRIHNLRTMPLKSHACDELGFTVKKKESKIVESIEGLGNITTELGDLGEESLQSQFSKSILFGTQTIFGAKQRYIIHT